MAIPTAPSSCFAESTDPSLATVYWTDNSSDEVDFIIERSLTSGSGFAEAGRAAANETVFFDTGLTSATRYFYRVKASNADGNSAASNEGNVTTQTCDGVSWPGNDLQLPRSGGDIALTVDDMASQLEKWAGQTEGIITDCSVNGAVIIDLSLGCNHSVTMTEDINSISIINSDRCQEGVIDFVVPAGDSFNISGFPLNSTDSFGFEQGGGRINLANNSLTNRTFSLPFVTSRSSGAGSGNRPRSIDKAKPKAAKPPGTGGATGPCLAAGCGPNGGSDLALSCEFSNGSTNTNCSQSCSGDQILLLVASGGVPPYTWSTTGGTLASVTGSIARLDPPTNSGSGVAGRAYIITTRTFTPAGCTIRLTAAGYGCGDVQNQGNAIADCCSPTCTDECNCPLACTSPQSAPCGTHPLGSTYVCDCRTQAMIDAGCAPCGSVMPGVLVTVTDAQGTAVSKTVTS